MLVRTPFIYLFIYYLNAYQYTDTSVLLSHLTPLDSSLAEEEVKRNSFGTDHKLGECTREDKTTDEQKVKYLHLTPEDKQWVARRAGFPYPLAPSQDPLSISDSISPSSAI